MSKRGAEAPPNITFDTQNAGRSGYSKLDRTCPSQLEKTTNLFTHDMVYFVTMSTVKNKHLKIANKIKKKIANKTISKSNIIKCDDI